MFGLLFAAARASLSHPWVKLMGTVFAAASIKFEDLSDIDRDQIGDRCELQAVVPEHRGVVFDDSGEAWPAQPAQLARRLGRDAEYIDILANAVRNLGFVHVAPIRDALAVTFEPSVVSPLAAVAAYYEIAARSPQCLILTYPGTAGSPERCEIFNNVIEGLRRLDNAAKRDPNAARPLWQQNAAGNRANRQPNLNTAPERNPAFRASRSGRPQVNSREDDYSVRLSKPLNTIAAEDEWLTQLLNFWGSARRGRRLPSNESLELVGGVERRSRASACRRNR